MSLGSDFNGMSLCWQKPQKWDANRREKHDAKISDARKWLLYMKAKKCKTPLPLT